jgi:hypothetical protein
MAGNLLPGRDGILVGRLRVRAGPDTLAARRRAERAAGAALVPPDGLRPSAVLCVRELRGRPAGARLPQAEGVRASLGRLLREAARPALGPVPAAAPAVLFADAAELLACLAADWCAQTHTAHWWWRALLRQSDGVQAVLQAWLDAPEYVPAALGHLARRGELMPFARALPAAGARRLLQALIRVFALPEVGTSLDVLFEHAAPTAPFRPPRPAPLPSRRPAVADTAGPAAEALPAPHHEPADQAAPDPPWADGVPEGQEVSLALPAQCVVGLGLMLHRAPIAVRGRPFAGALRRWARGRAAAEGPGACATASRPAACATASRPAADSRAAAYPPGQAAPTAEAAGVVPPFPPPTAPAAAPSPGAPREAPPLPDSAAPPGAEPHAPAPRGVPAAVPPPNPALPPGESLETHQGGVFYLTNLALFLGLYGDFTAPARAELPLPLWDFLALLGERLAGAALRSDPVWELLARLAGRAPGGPPGRDFVPPGGWRLPAGWLAAFPEPGAWPWSAGYGRLRVEHPAGFVVLDVPLEAGPAILQARRELQSHAAGELCEVAPRPEDEETRPLDRWLGWLMPYVRARLCRALGLAVASGLAGLLLAHRARVTVTATHLDVVFSLAELPLAIRLAGLDRDPGWVPAAGRFVAFHFE